MIEKRIFVASSRKGMTYTFATVPVFMMMIELIDCIYHIIPTAPEAIWCSLIALLKLPGFWQYKQWLLRQCCLAVVSWTISHHSECYIARLKLSPAFQPVNTNISTLYCWFNKQNFHSQPEINKGRTYNCRKILYYKSSICVQLFPTVFPTVKRLSQHIKALGWNT